MAVGGAVLGSLQFGYNTGVINAPQKVSAVPSWLIDTSPFCSAPHTLTHSAFWVSVIYINSPSTSPANFLALNKSETLGFSLETLELQISRTSGPIEIWSLNRSS